jgi:hypothetical protein
VGNLGTFFFSPYNLSPLLIAEKAMEIFEKLRVVFVQKIVSFASGLTAEALNSKQEHENSFFHYIFLLPSFVWFVVAPNGVQRTLELSRIEKQKSSFPCKTFHHFISLLPNPKSNKRENTFQTCSVPDFMFNAEINAIRGMKKSIIVSGVFSLL